MSKNIVVVQSFFLLPDEEKKAYKENMDSNWTGSPKDKEYVRVPFRLLSAHIVGAGTWKATEFSEAILKNSMPLLEGRPVYLDHDFFSVRNAVGVVERVEWQERNGEIPAGINGVLKIDAHAHPTVARAVIADPAIIQACSVGIEYAYLPSHAFEKDWEFMDKIGEIVDGRMVVRVVQEIKDYRELSLVGSPADPFAKKLDKDGKPYKPNMHKVAKFSEEPEEVQAKFKEEGVFMLTSQIEFAEATDNTPEPSETEETEVEVEVLPEAEETPSTTDNSDEQLEAYQAEITKLKKHIEDSTTLNTVLQEQSKKFEAQVSDLNAKLTAVMADYEQAKTLVKFAHEVIDAKRAEVLRCYNLSTNEPSEKVLKLIADADLDQLGAYMDMYALQLVEKFSPTCKNCGDSDISFRSSTPEGEMNAQKTKSKSSFRNLFRR